MSLKTIHNSTEGEMLFFFRKGHARRSLATTNATTVEVNFLKNYYE